MRSSRTPWILGAALVLAGAGLLFLRPSARAQGPVVHVVKSSTCGCCSAWIAHLEHAGFRVEARDVDDATLDAAMRTGGVPEQLAACHTATVAGYTIEGHVPAADIERLLAERPAIRGLAVPGMPGGSPGMESAPPERYQVIAFDSAGGTSVWAVHGP
ncbi:MAG: DUF411 domain-containing protein [Candidatus Palauibacterales bacterium]|nr:DUF411 domain-containing protein [Candidatus Palauibacterales bacterium]MDP2529176.1 DUF411 domain-containing protein [Candidatus Palauibacterales bacterium]MDP2583972.1 DUF411 domain-containing protein [Candidatus Palauibacterales bacterium]